MISVIIPAYNREKTIEDSIRSVLDQTYEDIEIIIVDDASTDRTEEIVKGINDKRIVYYKLFENGGACVARNMGIDLARGEYIAFQDSDDKWLPHKLESQLKVINQKAADVIFCSMRRHKNNKEETIPSKSLSSGFISYNKFLEGSIASTQTILGKSECFKIVKFDENLPRLQDWDLILRLATKFKVFYQDEVLVDVYYQNESISALNDKKIIALEVVYYKHLAHLKKNKYLNAKFLDTIGTTYEQNNMNGTKYFCDSFMLKPNIKVFIKLLLSSVRLLKYKYN